MRLLHGAAIIAAVAGSAVAADTVRFYDTGNGTTSGGEFEAQTGLRGTFVTFCIERNEHVSMGRQYWYEISDAAIFGGSGGGTPTRSLTRPGSSTTASARA
jgi:hypothetical protein